MAFFIGFDIGGTKCAVSLGKWFNQEIEILKREEVATKDSPYDTFDNLAPFVDEWINNFEVKSAGISCGGPLDSDKGVIISTPNLCSKWYGFEIVKYIKSRFNLNAKLENDANACAVAEWKFGAGKGAKNVVFMTFGTGLGAGLILDGKLYSGTNGNAGEIGHVRLEQDGPIGYNKTGSAEGFCSGNGIRRLAQIRAREKGICIDENITTKIIFEKARKGEEFYLSVIQETEPFVPSETNGFEKIYTYAKDCAGIKECVEKKNPLTAITIHEIDDKKSLIFIMNNSREQQRDLFVLNGVKITKIYRGNVDVSKNEAVIPVADAVIFEVEKNV